MNKNLCMVHKSKSTKCANFHKNKHTESNQPITWLFVASWPLTMPLLSGQPNCQVKNFLTNAVLHHNRSTVYHTHLVYKIHEVQFSIASLIHLETIWKGKRILLQKNLNLKSIAIPKTENIKGFSYPFTFKQKESATSKSTLFQLYPLQFQRNKTFVYFNYDQDIGENPALLLYICVHHVEKHEREMRKSQKINFVLFTMKEWIKSLGENQ